MQFPDHDDAGNPTEDKVNAIIAPDNGDWSALKKRIGGWFHFSYMGFGHSEVLERLSVSGRHFLPTETKYETQWWWRRTTIDGAYHGKFYDKPLAIESAHQYGKLVATGNLTVLRQFLERSFNKTERPESYYKMFNEMLTIPGKDQLLTKLTRFLGRDKMLWFGRAMLQSAVKIILGFTRIRKLLVPEWSDDSLLWR